MTQYDGHPEWNPRGDEADWAGGSARTSLLAVSSLVCGLVFCVPVLTPLLGITFGIAALLAIPRSEGRLKGKGVAVTGLVISLVVALGQALLVWVIFTLGYQYAQMPAQRMDQFLSAIETGAYFDARKTLASNVSASATDEQFATLVLQIQKDYGHLVSARVEVMEWLNTHDPDQFNDVPVTLTFVNGTASAMVTMRGETRNWPTMKLESFEIQGPMGVIKFPPEEGP